MPPKVLLVGISGPSSSGKTTLSRHLRDLVPNLTILHADDFYRPDAAIPVVDGLADWDCLESLDVGALAAALAHVRAHGASPPDLVSKEDRNAVGASGVDAGVLAGLGAEARARVDGGVRVAVVDGFLLYSEGMREVREMFDVKLFLRTDYATAKGRREARAGYVTLDGFWEDPPGYVDKVVWPNYVKDHAFLFEGGDVEGTVDAKTCGELGIEVMPVEARGDMTTCVKWAYDILMRKLVEART